MYPNVAFATLHTSPLAREMLGT